MRPLLCILLAFVSTSPSSAQDRPPTEQALAVGWAATAGMAAGAVGGAYAGGAACGGAACRGLLPGPVVVGFVAGGLVGVAVGARLAHRRVGGTGAWVDAASGAVMGVLGGAGVGGAVGAALPGAIAGGVAVGAWLYTRPLSGRRRSSSFVVAPGHVAYVRRF